MILSWRGPGHPNAGGAEISTHEHAKAWVKAGHSVTLFTSQYEGAKEEEMVDKVLLIRRGDQFFSVHWEAFKWYTFADHPKYDLIIDQFHGIPFFTPFYIRVRKLGFIHEVTKEVWKLNQLSFPLNYFVYVLGLVFEPLIFQLYKKTPFFTVSQSTKKDLTEWGIQTENITVINNGMSKASFGKIPPKEMNKTIIYLGALAKDKGIEDALQTFSILNKDFRDWQFWVVGKSDSLYLENLELLSGKLGIKNKIKFWGFVSEQKKYKLLARAHVLINPSIREGWGLVVIEAASMGIPTVAYNVPGLKDSVLDGKTGLLCECSPEALAVKVKELLADDRRYNEICKNAIDRSRNFSWEKSTHLSLNLIEKLVNYKK
ncbi:MAG: glycosyltransferase family 4 protein [Candidatus Daviesbacteria bacterium]|nr:glycosyltransferase family 4 protein [Candidatus Daviesbacteria bacterium]